jgi:AraC-like DNA-binding protein
MASSNQHTRPWTGAHTRQLKRLHAEGLSLNAIARQMGYSPSGIHTHTKRLGLSFDRTQTEAANVARSVDAKARRQAAADRIWAIFDDAATQAESVRDGKFKTLVKGKYGRDVERELDFIPSDHGRQLAATLGQLVGAATKIEAIDSDSGVADAVSMLGRLAKAIGLSDEVDDTTDDADA